MIIIGCDFHTRYQQIAMMDEATGELVERRLDHEEGEAGGPGFQILPAMMLPRRGWATLPQHRNGRAANFRVRILARQRQLNCGLTLHARGCDDYAACDDEQSADEDCQRWNLLECQPRDRLSGEKEKHHVEAEQFAEVPRRGVDSPSVGEQDERGECKQRGLLPGRSFVEACPDQCVSAGFQKGG
jgi:hypothetical protein